MTKSLPLILSTCLLKFPSVLLVLASTGFGCVYAFGQGSQHGVVLAWLSVAMAAGLELAKPLSLVKAVSKSTPWQSRIALGALALFAALYSLSAETSLVATNRQAANAQRSQLTAQHQTAQADLDAAHRGLAGLGPVRPVAEAERAVASDKLDVAWMRTSNCTDATLTASRAFCQRYFSDQSELINAQSAQELTAKIEAAEKALVATAGVNEADPGAASVVVYLSALGITADPEKVSKLLVLLAVVGLEVGSLTAGLLVSAGVATQGRVAQSIPVSVPTSVPTANEGGHAIDPDEVIHWQLTGDNPGSDDSGHLDENGGHAIAERLLKTISVASGVAISHREWARQLGCSKSAVDKALGKLVTDGSIVKVQASKGKGSAYKVAVAA